MESAAPSHDKRWEKFLVSTLFEALREAATQKFESDSREYEGSKSAAKRAAELRKVLLTRSTASARSNHASANTFIGGVAAQLSRFLSGMKLIGRFKDGTEFSQATISVLGRNGRVELALRDCEDRLRFLLPDLAGMDENRWPGHITFRAGLNHYVAVCVRVHSILPEVPFDAVTFAAARRIFVPALAHNLKFFAKSHPELYRKFVHDDGIGLRSGLKLSEEDAVAGLPGESRHVARKWRRLFNLCLEFGKFWGMQKTGELYQELQALLRDYEADPRSSRLWRDLSILAAGDMAVDEMLVSWVIEDVGGDPSAQATGPLVSCARSRFGLLRFAYLMTKEADEIREDFGKGMAAARSQLAELLDFDDEKAPDETSKRVFGWAYILSRHNLLGRNQSAPRSATAPFSEAGVALFELLNQLRFKASSPAYRALALRYLLGFMSNPRFVKPLEKMRQDPRDLRSALSMKLVEELISEAEKIELIPGSVVRLARGRVALHYAFAHRGDAGRSARDLQSALDHYAAILSELDSPSKAGIMDSEVVAWALPEMHYAIGLLSAHDPSSLAEWRKVQDSLQLLGEMQYGVFFNSQEESKRIQRGLEISVDADRP